MAPPVKPSTVGKEIAGGFETADGTRAADYISAHLVELVKLAHRTKLIALAYLLEMAELEADDVRTGDPT